MLIAWRDYVSGSDVSEYGTFGWAGGAPLENVKDRRLGVLARGTDPNDSHGIRADWGYLGPVGFIGILGHNHKRPNNPTVDVTLFRFATPVHTQTFTDVWVPGEVSTFPGHMYLPLSAEFPEVSAIEISISAPFPGPAEIGRIWAGPCWRPSGKTSDRDFEVLTRDNTIKHRTIGEQTFADYRARFRELRCNIPLLPEAEAIGLDDEDSYNLQDIGFEVGVGAPVIVVPTESSGVAMHKYGVYGTFSALPTLRLIGANKKRGRIFTGDFNVVEDL